MNNTVTVGSGVVKRNDNDYRDSQIMTAPPDSNFTYDNHMINK